MNTRQLKVVLERRDFQNVYLQVQMPDGSVCQGKLAGVYLADESYVSDDCHGMLSDLTERQPGALFLVAKREL